MKVNFQIINTSCVHNNAIIKFIFVTHTIFCDVNLVIVWVICFDAKKQIIQAFWVNEPVPISSWNTFFVNAFADTFNFVNRCSFIACTVVMNSIFTIVGFDKVTLIMVNTKIIVTVTSFFHFFKVAVKEFIASIIRCANFVKRFHCFV